MCLHQGRSKGHIERATGVSNRVAVDNTTVAFADILTSGTGKGVVMVFCPLLLASACRELRPPPTCV